tara:strand:+ start:215 stop:448 length:234 start_codon:yes stop_codon:yes gene_type:complete
MHKVGYMHTNIREGDSNMKIGSVDWGRLSMEMSKYIGIDHRTKKQNDKIKQVDNKIQPVAKGEKSNAEYKKPHKKTL